MLELEVALREEAAWPAVRFVARLLLSTSASDSVVPRLSMLEAVFGCIAII